MTAFLWLAAGLACAQLGPLAESTAENPALDARAPEENVAPPRPAASKIAAVTVYQGQALVTREVSVPEGEGTIELVVTPLPALAVDGSLYTEGTESLGVLSTRLRTRAVKDDTRQEVRTRTESLKKLEADALRLQKELAVQQQDLSYLQKLEGFTAGSLPGLTREGRLDTGAVVTLSRFIMESRGAKSTAENDLHRQLQANAEATEFARRQLAELSTGASRIERDAVIVVHKARRESGSVRLGYLVGSASWRPQYRLRSPADNAPVRLEYLAAVVQQTGEAWSDVHITLSNARPALDAAPPELLPLKMNVVEASSFVPSEANDERSRRIVAELEKVIDMSFANETPLEDVIKYVRSATSGTTFPVGIPIYIDPVGLQQAEKTPISPVVIQLSQVPLKTTLKLVLEQLGLMYKVQDGLLKITSMSSEDQSVEVDTNVPRGFMGVTAGMGGVGQSMELEQASGGAMLNQAAASDQAEELHVTDGPGLGAAPDKDSPSVTFTVAGRLDIPSRRDPQLLEVARIELPAEYYAKAVPVLTPRVYRLARVNNTSDLVLLPGEATVYVGGDFVGRMRLPLVAAGEPFIAGFGVDPQLQVSRRLIHKARSVQGGNQIFTYEFRIGLRNYRSTPVKVQLWDRLPRPQGEAVAVNLVKTAAELSTDAMYQRTARMDNLLRWDLEVPRDTVGDKTLYLNYEFRLEYARDLPQPRFVSGGLREGPIGGGAMGGMGGMGGGMGGMGGGIR
jgi:hypothetical protein